jgi:hypothetical protein
MRTLLFSGVALAAMMCASGCMTARQHNQVVADKCGATAGFTEIARPENAQAYLDAIEPRLAPLLRRGWPFETHWFRAAAGHNTILCNVAPAYNADRRGEGCIRNQFGAVYSETPAGPVKIDDVGVVCID